MAGGDRSGGVGEVVQPSFTYGSDDYVVVQTMLGRYGSMTVKRSCIESDSDELRPGATVLLKGMERCRKHLNGCKVMISHDNPVKERRVVDPYEKDAITGSSSSSTTSAARKIETGTRLGSPIGDICNNVVIVMFGSFSPINKGTILLATRAKGIS